MPDASVTELLWYFATLFGCGMLVVIWWALRTGFTRLIKIVDGLILKVDTINISLARTEQRLDDHIKNEVIHSDKRR